MPQQTRKKLILMGTNDFVVPVFDFLSKNHDIISVFTRAPKPVGRKHILTRSPVHDWAVENGISVHTTIREFNIGDADYVFIMSYGVLLSDNILSTGKFINIHPSSLPKYRGASPIRTALLNGDTDMDVCLMQIVSEMDAGGVYLRKNINIDENDTNKTLEKKVSQTSIEILQEFFADDDKFFPEPQIGEPTYTRKFTGSDEIIDWTKTPYEIHNLVRALGCGRTKINGVDVKIVETAIKNSGLEIIKIQPAGKTVMDWKSFVNGLHGAEIKYGE